MTPGGRDVVGDWADRICTARAQGRLLDPPSSDGRPLDLDEAYAVQALLHRRRLDRGERAAGWKLGYTSAAMREQMGIDQPNSGPLTDAMVLRAAAGTSAVLPATVRHPRVEPEVALLLGAAPDSVSKVPLRQRVTRAYAALEVVDSTWHDYRFTLEDNTADGSSAAYIVLGEQIPLDQVEDLAVRIEVAGPDDTVGHEANSAAAMGSPWAALDWLEAHLAGRGVPIGPVDGGQVVVMTGGLTAAIPLPRGGRARAWFGANAEVSLQRG